jgi:hypothetical protein
MSKRPLEKWMRLALFASVPVNFIGAAVFAPPLPGLRNQLMFPETHPFYLWILSIWIFVFGCCYLFMAVTERRDRIFVATAAIGKLSFAGLLMAYALNGGIPVSTGVSGLIDLALGSVFAYWLLTTRVE